MTQAGRRARLAWRYLWASPNTVLALGLGLALGLAGARVRWREGALEVYGMSVRVALGMIAPKRRIAALTLGHVVFAPSQPLLRRWSGHERVHVRQYEQWGIFFLPAYAAASGWAWACGRNPYRDNYFERRAYASGELF